MDVLRVTKKVKRHYVNKENAEMGMTVDSP
jgi:hypothetical protein